MWQLKRQVVGLDLGSTRIRTLMAEAEANSDIKVTGFGNVPSDGIKNGIVVNIGAAVEATKASANQAGEMARCYIDDVFLGVGGPRTRAIATQGQVLVKGRQVGNEDVHRAVQAALDAADVPDCEILHVLPDTFTCDGRAGIENPIGLRARDLGVDGRIFISSTATAWDAVTIANHAGLKVADTVLKPMAAADATLSDDEKEMGCMLVDVGGGETGVSIYSSGVLRHAALVQIGASRLTRDVAIVYKMPPSEAERIKREYGCARESMTDREDKFESLHYGSYGVRKMDRSMLAEVLQPRAEEIVEFVRAQISATRCEDALVAGVVLTGGGARLHAFPELMGSMLGLPVRVGAPTRINDARFRKTEYATLVGLVEYGQRQYRRDDWFTRAWSEWGI